MKNQKFEIDEERIFSDTIKAANQMVNSKSSQERQDFNELASFNSILYDFFGRYIDVEEIFNIKPYLYDQMAKYSKKHSNKFRNFVYENKDFLLEISKNLGEFSSEIGFLYMPYEKCFRKYSLDEIKNIILNFYASYSPTYYNIVKRYFDEGRVGSGFEFERGMDALFTGLQSLDSGYIFADTTKPNSAFINNIVHEFGHAIDAETFLYPQKKLLDMYSDMLVEVPSVSFEYLFLNKLVSERIDYTGGLVLKNILYDSLFMSFSNLKKSLDDENMSITDTGEAIMTTTSDILIDGEKIDVGTELSFPLREAIIYDIGKLYALYFSLLEKSSKKEFLNAYNSVITGRKEDTLYDSIRKLGISPYDFAELKYVKDDIKDDTLKLKKRFNYYS